MDFYQFINSQDIREHLTEIEYQFTSLECAFIVWQSLNHTLAQKWEAWEWLIENTPDCAVPERMNCAGWKSLHGFLRAYIELEKKYLSLFERIADNAVYTFDIQDDLGRQDRERSVFGSLDDCLRCVKSDYLDEYEDYDFPVVTKNFIRKEGAATHTPVLIVKYTRNLEPKEITFYCFDKAAVHASCLDDEWIMSEEDGDLAYLSFNGMWFDIPTPFHVGDVVCDCNTGEPFVLLGMNTWSVRNRKNYESYVNGRNGDTSDMFAYGYSFIDECPGVRGDFLYDDHMINYLNCEYYRKPLVGKERLIGAYALYVKGEIDAWELLRLDRLFKAEDEVKNNLPDEVPLWLLTEDKQKALNIENREGAKDGSDLFTYLKNLAPKKRRSPRSRVDNPDA